jgi:hypothetical protein
MDSNQTPRQELTPSELQIRLTIMRKMTDLHARIGTALADWAALAAAEDGARGARFVRTLLHEVTMALDDAYRRRLINELHPLEQEHWVPALECIRQELRKASASLSMLPGARLEQAVETLRRSMLKVRIPDITTGPE